jgi:hypothetical protein
MKASRPAEGENNLDVISRRDLIVGSTAAGAALLLPLGGCDVPAQILTRHGRAISGHGVRRRGRPGHGLLCNRPAYIPRLPAG